MAQTDEAIEDLPEERAPEEPEGEEASPPKKPKAPPTRKRVSGVELEARFDDWVDGRRARRAERTPEDAARVLRRGIAAAMGAGVVALVIAFGATSSSYESDRSGNQDRITALEGQLEQARAVPEDTGAEDQLAAVAAAASKDGKSVAAAQQAFADLHRRMSTEPDPGNGAPNQAAQDMAEHRKDLAPYFDPGTFIADDEDAYIWQNVPPYDEATEIDPRYAWYVRYDGEAASPATASTWSLETVTPVLDAKRQTAATDQATVVWLCRDAETGDVLAWARSTYTYDAATQKGTFGSLDLVITAAGAEHQQSTGAKPANRAPELGDGEKKDEEKGGGR